ncbi:MurR/RpiR family transcriptional regulator [Enterococcus mundtii]|uniref:MurR/RpiR family transcriptional regulator n=1 Tax=Enterococcus mundtii TaxID=53346 RepID=UPI0013779DA6|nr:MurR/RpiR family transcriptional regulator [Enterococcus mundtii]NBA63363.1 SIS domain-containing protein [Enterococcus mundtii]
MNQFYKRIQYKFSELNQVEKNILDYCLHQSRKVSSMTAEELASETFTSQSTITRMAKKLGFKGFQEFKFALKSYRSLEETSDSTDVSDEFKPLINEILRQFTETLEKIEPKQIDRAVHMIKEAQRIELFAVGQSIPVAVSLNRKLHFLGKNVGHSTDWDELRAVSKQLGEGDLAIFISHSGETLGMLDYAKRLKDRNVPLLSFIGQPTSSLEELSTVAFIAEMLTIYHQNIDLSPRVSMDILLDILMIHYAKQVTSQNGDSNL